MPVAVVFNVPGMSAQQYDQIIAGLEGRGEGSPDGRLAHVAAPADGGWMVFDVWESEEKFGRFAEVLMPIVAGAGVNPPPQPRVYPVHSFVGG